MGRVSRESLGATAPGVEADDLVADLDDVPTPADAPTTGRTGPPQRPPDGPAGTGDAVEPGTGRAAGGPPAAPPAGPHGPSRTRGVPHRLVVALVALGLVVGGLGGATSVRQQAQAEADAGTRVVLVLADDIAPREVGVPPPVGDTLVLVTVAMTGGVGGSDEAVVESLRTPLGELTLFPAVRFSPAEPGRQTLLRGRVDCSVVAPDGPVDGRLLARSVARVRPAGSRRTVEVPVLVANPTGGIAAIQQRCVPPEPETPVPFTVNGMAGRTDGTVVLVVAPDAGQRSARSRTAPVRFGLVRYDSGTADQDRPFAALVPLRADAGSATFALPDTAWTVTTSPPMPFEVTAPTSVRLRFAYTCPRSPRRGTAAGLPAFPEGVEAGAVGSDGGVTSGVAGWQSQAFLTAAIAAAVTACPAPGTRR